MGYTATNATEKKINDMHERMMTREDFANFSTGISEDLHTKASTLGKTIKQGMSNILVRHTIAIIICAAIVLWIIILGSVAMFNLHQQIDSMRSSINEFSVTLNATVSSYEVQLEAKNAELDQLTATIDSLEAELAASKAKVEELEAQAAVPAPIIINYTDITHKSGLTAEQFDTVISTVLENYNKGDTQLTGLGQALYDMENEYDVNGFLALGISGIESGWGRSKLAVNHNNLYGLLGMSFDSTYDCTMYFGGLMRNHYIGEGRTSLSSISKKYCGGNSDWVSDVSWFIGIYVDTAKDLYQT